MFMFFFIESSRKSDLNLNLQAGEAIKKPLFAFDRLKYKHLQPRFIADMKDLRSTHPKTWHQLETDTVTKSEIPFVYIGDNQACRQVNKMMKIPTVLDNRHWCQIIVTGVTQSFKIKTLLKSTQVLCTSPIQLCLLQFLFFKYRYDLKFTILKSSYCYMQSHDNIYVQAY